MPQISIVVPVYKVEPYLHKCVDSILAQSFKDFELILVDDGSPDNCPAICDEYAKQDKRIIVIHQANGGLSAARNSGINWSFANSDSEWITFIDSDDWVHPDMLSCLYSAANVNEHNLIVCGFQETENNAKFQIIDFNNNLIITPEDFFLNQRVNSIVAWGKLYKKSFFKSIRYPVGKIHEDEFVTYKILFANKLISYIPVPLYFYRKNENSITNAPWSLKRLHGFEAQYEQLLYFKSKKLTQLLNACVPSYLHCILQQQNLINSKSVTCENKKLASKTLKKLFKKTLVRFKRIVPFKKYNYFYEYAFPKMMRFYWQCIGVKNKLSSVFRGGHNGNC